MNRFLAGAQSVYSFLRNTAERTEDGFRWQTYDYSNNRRYHYCIFNGVGGIPIFLCEYYRFTNDTAALALAEGAVKWCMKFRPSAKSFERGLQLGRTGVAYSALLVSHFTSNEDLIAFAEANARVILTEPPGPITDFLSGEASNGWFLLHLWRRTNNIAYLQGAVRSGEWIGKHFIRESYGTYCLVDPIRKSFGERAHMGLSHGIAGVALFLATLYDATKESHWRSLSYELLDTLKKTGISIHGGLNWSPKFGETALPRCQYSHGAPGIGLSFAACSRCFDDTSLLEVAVQAGEATYGYGDFRSNPTLCTGVAGGGELFLELFRQTADIKWKSRGEEFGDMALKYRSETSEGDRWPTDTAGLFSADFTYGASGTGYFLLGVADPIAHAPPLI